MERRRFRFGIETTDAAPSREAWAAKARKIEALGYATLLVDDHLDRRLAPIAALAAAAEATASVRLGSFVLGNDFRHPVVLAKEAATLDVLSGGRLELGLGTGYRRTDYEQPGIAFDPPAVRVARFEEAVRVVKGFFADAPFTFAGRYYRVQELDGVPKPVQRPHPPILIGGGSKRILSIAAREADIVAVNIRTTPQGEFDFTSITAEATAQKVAWVREAAGARFESLELNILAPLVAVTADRRGAAEQFLRFFGLPTDAQSVAQLLDSPVALIGSIDQIVEDLVARRERYGFSYVVVWDNSLDAFAPVVARLAGR